MNILFVCTGNVCRSPMAEGFLKQEAGRRGLRLGVRSTGTHAWPGRAATIDGRRTMQELGVPIDEHRTLPLTQELVEWSDLIIGLAREHTRDTQKEFADAKGKTFTLKELLAVLPSLPDMNGDAAAWVSAVFGLQPAGLVEDPDVDDPLGERKAAYLRVAVEIQELIARLAAGLESKGVGRA